MGDRGFKDPRRQHQGAALLDPHLKAYTEKCKEEDPAPRRQQALPSSVVEAVAGAGVLAAGSRRFQAASELVVVAFFFLLRVGEYTQSPAKRARTVPLRKGDIKLWLNGATMDLEAPLETLVQADAATICLENQKNGHKGCVLHHEASGELLMCPVKALARRMFALRGLPRETPISAVGGGSPNQRVSPSYVLRVLRMASKTMDLEQRGFDLSRIGTHSLRSGGAMALKLNGYDDVTIQKLGRWSSNTYLVYVQTQVANLSAGIARAMARRLDFHMVG